ncbi:MAG: BREX-1 system phosphatase PglZ type B [Prolixibacteraceae bacterium]
MANSIFDKVIQALGQAEQHNSSIMVKPEVILWPDPERQWTEVIPAFQTMLPQLLVFGSYNPDLKQGPAIWIKCMVTKALPEANWADEATPIIYLPGVAKNDLRNVQDAGLEFQPLLEYQYTGTLFTQENGKEWSILAFVENSCNGLGIKILKDTATKDALRKALPTILQDGEVLYGKTIIDADYLNNQLFPDIVPSILKWMCKGDSFLQGMDQGIRETFANLCQTNYDFEPDYRNIKTIAEKLGSQRLGWKYVWQMYATAPKKYPEIEELLRNAKPNDLGIGVYALPDESWPQLNAAKEEELLKGLVNASKLVPKEALGLLKILEQNHQVRRNWVWSEMGYAPFANALQYLVSMATISTEPFPSTSIADLRGYYVSIGYKADQAMRKSLVAVKTDHDKSIIKSLIQCIYQPWIELITNKFQDLVENDSSMFTTQKAVLETDLFVLFVDAFRFELAQEFCMRLLNSKYHVILETGWSAIPTLTPTAKPAVSPVATSVSGLSDINEFRPQLQTGKDLHTNVFREALVANNFKSITSGCSINPEEFYWQEIGDIDKKGHEEQSDMVRRIEELFEQVKDVIDHAFDQGVKRIKIVTDHGWLLLPGGLPKKQLDIGLTETRWGRCALIKEGVQTDLLHLPWRWNPSVFIAYAPGISFFRINEEYAHGGISLHECLVPILFIDNPNKSKILTAIKEIKWVNLKCAIITEGSSDGVFLDIRTKYNDEKTSIVESKNMSVRDNRGSAMVSEDAESNAVTIVLLDESGRILDKKLTTVGG